MFLIISATLFALLLSSNEAFKHWVRGRASICAALVSQACGSVQTVIGHTVAKRKPEMKTVAWIVFSKHFGVIRGIFMEELHQSVFPTFTTVIC